MKGRKTLEINPEHPIVQALKDKVDSDASGAKVSAPTLYLPLDSSAKSQRCCWVPVFSVHWSLQALATATWAANCISTGVQECLSLLLCCQQHTATAFEPTPLLCLQAVAELMYDTALVTSGFSVDNPREFAQRIYSMVGLAVNADPARADAAASVSSAEPVQAEVVDPSDPWKSS